MNMAVITAHEGVFHLCEHLLTANNFSGGACGKCSHAGDR